jgi:diguanylate cyclase (GGDEF)-like protein
VTQLRLFPRNGRLPVLVLDRTDQDGGTTELLARRLGRSRRFEVAVAGPDALRHAPASWPVVGGQQPVALIAHVHEHPTAVAAVARLVRRLEAVPLVVVASGGREFTLAVLEAGAEEVLESASATGPALERAVLSAVSRRVADARDADRPGTDALTGLDVRAQLDLELPERLERARRAGTRVAVLYCDLDRFKLVNDTLGHGVGDVVLVEAAGRLRAAVRRSDLVVRLGGDEFVVVVDGPDAGAAADEVAARLLSSFTAPIDTDDHALNVGISIGLAVAEPDEEPAALLGRADRALYRAKRRGRGRVARYDRDLELTSAHAASSVELLRTAIRGDRLDLDVRRVVDQDLGRVVGYAYQAAWGPTPDGRAAPGQVPLEVAADAGLGPALFCWTASRTVADTERGRTSMASVRRFVDLPVAVLASSPGRTLEPILSRAAVEPTDVVAVIDEQHLSDTDNVRIGLLQLARLGLRVCIGSFGSVHGSLVLMERHPFDSVRVDRRNVDGLASCPVRRARLRAVSVMATALGQQVLVPAPARPEDARALADIGGLVVVERTPDPDQIVLPDEPSVVVAG